METHTNWYVPTPDLIKRVGGEVQARGNYAKLRARVAIIRERYGTVDEWRAAGRPKVWG